MALTISIDGKGIIANADGYSDTALGGTWNEDGAGADSFTTDTFLYGTQSFAGAYSAKAGFQYFDIGTGNLLNFDTGGNEEGQFIWMWINCPTIGLLESKANNGLSIRIGSSLSDYNDYLIAGSDDANGWLGDWKCFVMDPTMTPTSTNGSCDLTAIRYMGVWIDAASLAKGDNIFIDQIAVGTGLKVTGTSTTAWKDVVDYCTDYANRAFGMFTEKEGVYYMQGGITIGDTAQGAATSFADAGRVIQFAKSQYWTGSAWVSTYPADACFINIEDNASYSTTFQDGVLVGSDNGRSGSLINGQADQATSLSLHGGSNASSATLLYGSTLKNLTGALQLGASSNHKLYGVSIVKCAQFDPVGAPQLRNMIFAETADVDAALLWNESIDIASSAFIANTVGAAIEMPSAAGSPYAYDSLTFSGNTNDVLNSSGSAVTVNKNAGSNPSTYEGSAVTFSASFSHVIEGLELNTEVTYVTADTSTELFHVEEATVSDGNGKYKTTYTHSGGTNVDILIHHVNYQPDVSNIYGLTLPSADATVKVQMFADPNYANP